MLVDPSLTVGPSVRKGSLTGLSPRDPGVKPRVRSYAAPAADWPETLSGRRHSNQPAAPFARRHVILVHVADHLRVALIVRVLNVPVGMHVGMEVR